MEFSEIKKEFEEKDNDTFTVTCLAIPKHMKVIRC